MSRFALGVVSSRRTPQSTYGSLSHAALTILVALISTSCSTSSETILTQQSSVGSESDSVVIREMRSSLADFLEISDPPQVTPVRTAVPEEAAILVDKCMEDNGFAHDEFGAYSLPVSQKEQFNLTKYICTLRYPSEAKYYRPLTIDQKRIVYRYTVDVEIPCLEAEGFSINGVPSENTFISNFDNHTWFPRAQLISQYLPSQQGPSYEQFLDEHCPQWPPSKLLYG